MVNRIQKHKIRWQLVALAAIIVLAAIGVIVWLMNDHKTSSVNQSNASSTALKPFDKQSAASNDGSSTTSTKNAGSDTTSSSNSAQTSGSTVSVFIVDASQYNDTIEVRAHADTISDGTCTYTFVNGQTSFTEQTNAAADATTSSCATLDVDRSKFTQAGDWTVTVKYVSSTGASGVSSKTFTVK